MRVAPALSYFIGDIEDRLPYKTVLLTGLGGLVLVLVGFALTTNFWLLM